MFSKIAELATRPRPLWVQAGFSAIVFAVALLVRHEVDHLLPPGFPFLTFFPAVIVSALVCGWAAGATVAAASTLAAWYYFIPPFQAFGVDWAVGVALGFFIFIATIDILIIHGMRVALMELEIERRRVEKLAESRELLFQETQHRISNNLQVVAALLRLQRGAVQDETARKALEEAANRTAVVAKIQRQLLNERGEHVPLGALIKEIAESSLAASGEQHRIDLSVEAEDVFVPPEKSVPLGLVATELVANALEHAFPNGRKGRLRVAVQRAGKGLRLEVQDDGVGAPPDYAASKGSLGMRIAHQFVEQAGGRLALAVSGGSHWTVDVPTIKA